MDVRIDQALVSHFLAGDFGLEIAFENDDFTPSARTPYAEVLVIQNNTTPMTLRHTDQTDGVFRVILRYPSGSGAVAAKTKAQQISDYFGIGRSVSYGELVLTITSVARDQGVAEAGWYKMVFSATYRAAINRGAAQ